VEEKENDVEYCKEKKCVLSFLTIANVVRWNREKMMWNVFI